MMNHEEEFVFSGSLLDGLSVDLIDLAGLDLDDDERDRIWERLTPRDVLIEYCDCAEIDIDEFEGGPGMSDRYFEYRCGNKREFVERLRAALLELARESPS